MVDPQPRSRDAVQRFRIDWFLDGIVLDDVADYLALGTEDFAGRRNGPADHGRKVSLYAAQDMAMPVEDVAKLIDVVALEAGGQGGKVAGRRDGW